jgi:hypothetical protein
MILTGSLGNILIVEITQMILTGSLGNILVIEITRKYQ